MQGLEGWHLEKVERLRQLILDAAPKVTEGVRGGVLYYDDSGDIFAVAAQKHYVALYLLARASKTALADLFPELDCGKGCIRFKARSEIPEAAITALLEESAASSERNCGKG